MKIKRTLLVLLFLFSFNLHAAEFTNGALKLVIHEATGRFSLYSLTGGSPQALFEDRDPRTSFLSILVNDRSYKLGDTGTFKTRFDPAGPSLVFEAPFMSVTQAFSLSGNGVTIRITLENRGDRSVNAGARFLLDTNLGESSTSFPISTGSRTIKYETLITRYDSDGFWKDSNDKLSLSGSINTGSAEDPDSVHIANWKKLSEVTWKAPYQQGRNFNAPPYSVRDTAVCYYFEPRSLGAGERRTMSFTLAMNHEGSFNIPNVASALTPSDTTAQITVHMAQFEPVETATAEAAPAGTPTTVEASALTAIAETAPAAAAPHAGEAPLTEPAGSRDADLAMLMALQARINKLIETGAGTEGELSELELALNMLRAKYGLNFRQSP